MKKNINKIAVFANLSKQNVQTAVDEVKSFIESLGIETVMCVLSSDPKDYMLESPDADLAISLGGDGTVLTSASLLKDKQIPIIGVNLGTFGYITNTSLADYRNVLEDYIGGMAAVLERIRLEVSVVRNGVKMFETSALNDVTVSAATRAKIAKMGLSVGGTFVGNLRADGIIIATPTGSTAYNLSAGGPIIEAELHSIIINAICPFAIDFRPLVVKDSTLVEITIPSQGASVCVTSDGHKVFDLEKGDTVEIKKSESATLFVENKRRSTIELLRNKLGWAGGFNA